MGHKRKGCDYSIHHRLPRSQGGTNDPNNLSEVNPMEHDAYNIVFRDGRMHPERMARILTDVWIRPDFMMLSVEKKPGCKSCGKCLVRCCEE
jgi:hypothetical protein